MVCPRFMVALMSKRKLKIQGRRTGHRRETLIRGWGRELCGLNNIPYYAWALHMLVMEKQLNMH